LHFELLMSRRFEAPTRKLLSRIRQLGGGDGFRTRVAELAGEVYGAERVEALDEAFPDYVESLEPRWRQPYRSLETHGEEWEQIAFPEAGGFGANAIAWSLAKAKGPAVRVSGAVRVLPVGRQQMNLLLGIDENEFVSIAFNAGEGVTVFTYDGSKDAWNRRGFFAVAGLDPGPTFDFAVTFEGRALAIAVRGVEVAELELDRPLDGRWGLGAQVGSAGAWSKIRVR
jgi:hypothetical protein